jgi:hypothetical protein
MSPPKAATAPHPHAGHAEAHAEPEASRRPSMHIDIPRVGGVDLPPPRELAYLGGIAALTAVELIEWPVGLALAAGHLVVTRARGQRPDGHEHEKEQAQHKRE